MNINYKYIFFEQIKKIAGKTGYWVCYNKSSQDVLGVVCWYPYWRQYCFNPKPDTVFSASCLADIQDFLSKIKDWRKDPK